ncbi:hypothetical protein DWV00_32770 [Trinickia dinghuensis]|uniref:Uncharacterized protein n=2 Tax=Trinickia dinghuensis TaxID=2291023 RepID=A0A3D8JP69_9BURK|nr:hypothetical protein DWV00_32770 [Trinickia dinghuensis]
MAEEVGTRAVPLRKQAHTTTRGFKTTGEIGDSKDPHIRSAGDARYPRQSSKDTRIEAGDGHPALGTHLLQTASTRRAASRLALGRNERDKAIEERDAPSPSPEQQALAKRYRTQVEESVLPDFAPLRRKLFPGPLGGDTTLDGKAHRTAIAEFDKIVRALPPDTRFDVLTELAHVCGRTDLPKALRVLQRLQQPLDLRSTAPDRDETRAWRVAQRLSQISPGGINGLLHLQNLHDELHIGHQTQSGRLLVFLQASALLANRRSELDATPHSVLSSVWTAEQLDHQTGFAFDAIRTAVNLSTGQTKEQACTPQEFAAFRTWQWGARSRGPDSPFERGANLTLHSLRELIASSEADQSANERVNDSFQFGTKLLSWPMAKLSQYYRTMSHIVGAEHPAPFQPQRGLMGTDLELLEDRQYQYDTVLIAARSGLIGHLERSLPDLDGRQLHESALVLAGLHAWQHAHPNPSAPRPETFDAREDRPGSFSVDAAGARQIWEDARRIVADLSGNRPQSPAVAGALARFTDAERGRFVTQLAKQREPFSAATLQAWTNRSDVRAADPETAEAFEDTFTHLNKMANSPGVRLDTISAQNLLRQWKDVADTNSRGLAFNASDGTAYGVQGFMVLAERPVGIAVQITKGKQYGYSIGSDNSGFQIAFTQSNTETFVPGASYVGNQAIPTGSSVIPDVSFGYTGGGSLAGNHGHTEAAVFRATLEPRSLGGKPLDDEIWRSHGKEMADALFASVDAANNGREFIEEFAWRTADNPRIAMLTRESSSADGRLNVSLNGNVRATMSSLENPPAIGLFGGVTGTTMIRGSNTVETGEFPIVNVDTEYRSFFTGSVSMGLSMPGFALLEHAGPDTPHSAPFTLAGKSWDFARVGTTSNVYYARDSRGIVPRLVLYDTYYRDFGSWKEAVLKNPEWIDGSSKEFLEQLFDEALRQSDGSISWGIRTGLNPAPREKLEAQLNTYLSALDRIGQEMRANPSDGKLAELSAKRTEIQAGFSERIMREGARRPVALFGLATAGQTASTGPAFLGRATREQQEVGNSLQFLYLHRGILNEVAASTRAFSEPETQEAAQG